MERMKMPDPNDYWDVPPPDGQAQQFFVAAYIIAFQKWKNQLLETLRNERGLVSLNDDETVKDVLIGIKELGIE